VCQNRFVTYGRAALLCLIAGGCTGLPSLKSRAPTTPLAAPRPSVLKQFATAVSQSKVGKSVSLAFANATKKTTHKSDPTALVNGVEPTKAADYVALGESLEQNGDSEGARRMFHQALELEPHHLGALVALGRHFDRQGQLDRATESYLEATKFHPSSPTAFNDLGLCYARQRRYDDAVRALNRAIQLEPDRVLYRNNIAMVLVAQSRIDEALVHLTDAHGPSIAHYNLGCLLGKQGRTNVALEQFQLALADDPSLVDAREWIDALSNEAAPGESEQMLASQEPAGDWRSMTPRNAPADSLPRNREDIASRPVVSHVSPANKALQSLPPVTGEAPTVRY
jgi:Flp pilus assembly protein TadD